MKFKYSWLQAFVGRLAERDRVPSVFETMTPHQLADLPTVHRWTGSPRSGQ
jgi:hypothetical protein